MLDCWTENKKVHSYFPPYNITAATKKISINNSDPVFWRALLLLENKVAQKMEFLQTSTKSKGSNKTDQKRDSSPSLSPFAPIPHLTLSGQLKDCLPIKTTRFNRPEKQKSMEMSHQNWREMESANPSGNGKKAADITDCCLAFGLPAEWSMMC